MINPRRKGNENLNSIEVSTADLNEPVTTHPMLLMETILAKNKQDLILEKGSSKGPSAKIK